ncbi:MAG: acylphosphatase [Bryobacterales bacterium]|nr:acylphosphatase [Bryobacterales bacterium]
MSSKDPVVTRHYQVRGNVQGVGFRAFVSRHAQKIGVRGWVRNTGEGDVEVLAMGTSSQLDELAGYLRHGPMLSLVRGVEESEASPIQSSGFSVRD